MLNESFRLAAGATHGTVGVVWTAPAGDSVSFVFVNGHLAIEAFAPGTADRAIDVPLPDDSLAVIEIHDFAPAAVPEETPPSITIRPGEYTRPMIRFSTVPGAARYRLYHRPEGGAEARVWDAAASAEDGEWVEIECSVDLFGRSPAGGMDGRWHHFRVEAVSAYGVESKTVAWAWRTLDVPAAPRVTVAPGSGDGTFTFTITTEG